MREILFRGKSKITGEWFIGNLFDKDTKGRTHIQTTERGCLDIDSETVGQYTGRTDKKATKIFEGDIIKEKFKNHEKIYLIFWDEETCCFWAGNGDTFYGYPFNEFHFDNSEIIGNIHDNKELLK